MDEREFDAMLEDALTELPPSHAQTEEVTPWRRAMKRVVWGIGLTTLTINTGGLQYILPVQGIILSVLGYRALREENRWFRVCWLLSLYNAAVKFFDLVINATLIRLPELNLLVWLSVVLGFVQTFCLWKGIRAVRKKAGQPDEAGVVIALMLWELMILVLGLLGAGGWLFLLGPLIAYVFILRALGRIPALLDDAGYDIAPAPIRVPDMVMKVVWNAGVLACVMAATLLCCRYPMEWDVREDGEHAGLEHIEQTLIDLGVPEQVVKDLAPEDLALLEGADHAEVRYHWEDFRNTGDALIHDIAVRLPDDRWMAIHHFHWDENVELRTTECILLWPAYKENFKEGYRQVREITGRLLFDRDGAVYTGDYYSISDQTYTSQSFFGLGGGTETHPIATFSLPLRGDYCRGYLCYVVECLDDGWLFDSWSNYTHQVDLWVYPMMTAEEYEKSGIWNGHGGFHTSQNAVQFRPTELDAW